MKLRSNRLQSRLLVPCLLVISVLVACGGDDTAPPEVDAGGADAGRRDAAPDGEAVDAAECPDEDGDGHGATPCGDDCDDADASRYPGGTEVCDGDDEDCNDATYGADVDADGFESAACCNGADDCGADCDDALNTINPGAAEVCNAGRDDDCNGLADAADGVCVPCAGGYVGFDGACVDVDECAEGTAACSQIPRAPCVNTSGGFLCICPPGYAGDGRGGGGCTDVDECAGGLDDCEGAVGICTNTVGSFTCGCPTGFVGTGRGAGSCLWGDPSLASLTMGAGAALGPAFLPGTTTYVLTLAPGATSTTVTPTVAQPTRATITVAGTPVASGASATVSITGSAFATTVVDIVVTTETGATRTYTLVVGGGQAYVKASNTAASDFFSYAVSLSADGTRLAVGAYGEDSSATGVNGNQADDGAPNSGAVYVFARSGAGWAQEAYLKASNTGAGDEFGFSVSLSPDGTRLAVGARSEDSSATGIDGNQADNGSVDSGAVYVFSRTGTTWTQEAYVKASNTGGFDYFGASLSLSADGALLAVGAYGEDSSATGVNGTVDNAAAQSGAAYVLSRSGTTWTQEAYVKASNTGADDYLGISVSLSANGTRLAVGAFYEDSSATGINGDQIDNGTVYSGAVYVYSRSGTTWTQEAYVKASNTGAADFFGYALSLSADGTRLAVAAWGEWSTATGIDGNQADDGAPECGAVYVFSRSGAAWAQEAYVKASNTGASDRFGMSVSLSADGMRLAVGAHQEDSSATGLDGNQADNAAVASGAVYVFSRSVTNWAQEVYVKASNTGGADLFGTSVALSADGTQLAVGAYWEDSSATGVNGDQANNSATQSGAVYLY